LVYSDDVQKIHKIYYFNNGTLTTSFINEINNTLISVTQNPTTLSYTCTTSPASTNPIGVNDSPISIIDVLNLQPTANSTNYYGVIRANFLDYNTEAWGYDFQLTANNLMLNGHVDWHFNTDNWFIYDSKTNKIPIAAEISGTVQSLTNSSNSYTISDRYDFSGFIVGIDNYDSVFTISSSWGCVDNLTPQNLDESSTILTVFEIPIPIASLDEQVLIANLTKALSIHRENIYLLRLLSGTRKGVVTTLAIVELDLQTENRDAVFTILNTSNSLLGSSIVSQSFSTLSCLDNCSSNGDCHFGICICYAGWTGPTCEAQGVLGGVDIKYLSQYIVPIIIVCIALFFIGIIVGYISYTYFYKTDYKVKLQKEPKEQLSE